MTALREGVLSGARRSLARAITLLESRKKNHQVLAEELMNSLLPESGRSLRVRRQRGSGGWKEHLNRCPGNACALLRAPGCSVGGGSLQH